MDRAARALMVPTFRGQESSVGMSQDSIRLHTKWPTKAKKDFRYLDLGQVYFDLHMSLRHICKMVFMYQFTWKSPMSLDRHLHPEGQAIRRAR